ncbi:MAG: ATP-binding cassette domain-containing protein [Deltaproteobacteria bacterium]|nr:ATP-binding cassette domain-containing protein [Deltaproteobacteria bacterium]
MIRLEHVGFRYNRSGPLVLDDINLVIDNGEHIGIIGPNGSGKTTLVQLMNALLLPSEGRIIVDGLKTTDAGTAAEIRRRVGIVFQNPESQIVGMTVEEDTAFGPGNLALPAQEIRRRVDDCLGAVGLSGFQERSTHKLSGGEKRLLSIAGILAMQPRHIIFDEPTAFLDPAGRERVLAVIDEINRQGVAIIHISHHMEDILGADRIIVLKDGRIVRDGAPRQIFCDPFLLAGLQLDIPAAAALMQKLRAAGEPVRTDILTLDEAVAEIRSTVCGRRSEAQPRVP